VRAAIAMGAVLGAVSRVEEVTDGFDLGISSNTTWLLTAFAAGAVVATLEWSALAGALALTVANTSYYAYVLLTEPGRPLHTVAGPVDRWYVLGATGGAVFGIAGALARLRRFPPPTA
jgi:Family of unknown function (DUF6518)